jgi:hypothetical protein
MAVLVELFGLLGVAAAGWWRGGYWLGLNNGGLTLAPFLRHVVALLVLDFQIVIDRSCACPFLGCGGSFTFLLVTCLSFNFHGIDIGKESHGGCDQRLVMAE